MYIPKVTFPLAFTTILFAGTLANAQTTPGSTTAVETVPGTTTTETTTTTTAGLISELAPDGLVIRTETGTARYSSSASTIYVDETGRAIARELVTSGRPVTVHYTRSGERLIADRVIVRRQANTTTVAPTVIERNTTITNPTVVVEKPVIVEKKVPVVVEKKVYVDRPVAVEKKVYVDRPVVVEKPVIVEPVVPAPIIEKKTTTTTTTTKGKKDKDDD